jgi:hypothetical protein
MESYLAEREAKSRAEFDARLEALQARVDTAEARADAAQVRAQAAETKADDAQEALTRAVAVHKAETDALRLEVQSERDERLSQQATDQVLKDKLSEELQHNRTRVEAAEAKVTALELELAKKAARPPEPSGAEVAQHAAPDRALPAGEKKVEENETEHKKFILENGC